MTTEHTPTPDYLLKLATRLSHIPVKYGTDGGDVDRLMEISETWDALVKALEEAEKSLGDAECSLIEYEAPGSAIEYVQEARKQARDALRLAEGTVS